MAQSSHDPNLPIIFMNILFVHQNFPGQYLHLAQHLNSLGGNNIVGIGEADNIKMRGTMHGITTFGYPKPKGAGDQTHHYLQGTEAEVRRGQSVVRALLVLKQKGFCPDVICVHPGWGEGLFVRDVLPGEIVTIDMNGVHSNKSNCKLKGNLCVFEYIYFARPDSVIDKASVEHARMRAGAFLAQESPVDADIVVGVPDSGLDAALGYANESGIPYGIGFLKNKYIGRSFIQPSQDQREDAVRIKLNVIKENIKGKRVIMIDDSIVRGTTCARIVKLLREAGATEVHMRVSSPPFKHPCYFGTDVDSQENLIACKFNSVDEIAKEIGVDSLAYLSVEATHKIAEGANVGFCDGCFTGNYPIEVPKEQPKDKFEEKMNKFSPYYQVLD